MDKHTIHILALAALFSLYLVCSATVAQCRIIDATDSEKINLPNGLCARKRCKGDKEDCFCCLAEDDSCYWSMNDCKAACQKPPLLPAP
ncbi:hypothetical protein ZWY2020_045556 [Hordeum vulgare]|nr:hypothetical protein ZWY2020_045556 [Hordeum vulgare]